MKAGDAVYALGISDLEWMHEAACTEADRELFFSDRVDRIAEAKEICRDCPVRIACLVDALERGENEGVWGGTTGRERTVLLKRSGATSSQGVS